MDPQPTIRLHPRAGTRILLPPPSLRNRQYFRKPDTWRVVRIPRPYHATKIDRRITGRYISRRIPEIMHGSSGETRTAMDEWEELRALDERGGNGGCS